MFAFYDFETTGTSPKFDQPIQFAAILTDEDLNEIERVNIRCRLSPHIIPAPWALAVTGVTPAQLTDPTLPSWFEFTQQLREIINRWGPATWTGYNSLAFDEQFFRQSFYQCLQPNFYETQIGGNMRLDVMRVVFAAWELAQDVLQWQVGDNGKISFKLDRLAPANGFSDHDAHDALGDVEATIHLVKLIKNGAPHVWEQCLANRSKNAVIDLLTSGQPLRLVERFGANPPRSYFGCFCGRNPDNPNSVGFYDLDGGDPTHLFEDDDAIIVAITASPKRIRTIAVNNVPSMFVKEPVDPLHQSRADLIAARPDFLVRVGDALAGRYPDTGPAENAEERIYDGFYSAGDTALLNAWQTAKWEHRAGLRSSFNDDRLIQLARRLIYLNAPEHLTVGEWHQMDQAIRNRWSSTDPVGWTTLVSAAVQLDEIAAAVVVDDGVLEDLRAFYRNYDL